MPAMKPPEAKTILIRGGSIPAGAGTTRSYVHILRDIFAKQGIEVLNSSRAGETSFDGVETFHDDVEPFRPDILVIHFGIDDAFSAVYRSEFKENLVRMTRMPACVPCPRIFIPTSQPFENAFDMDSVGIFYRVIREVCADLDCGLIPVHTFWAGLIAEKGLPCHRLSRKTRGCPTKKATSCSPGPCSNIFGEDNLTDL